MVKIKGSLTWRESRTHKRNLCHGRLPLLSHRKNSSFLGLNQEPSPHQQCHKQRTSPYQISSNRTSHSLTYPRKTTILLRLNPQKRSAKGISHNRQTELLKVLAQIRDLL